jgi:hypothetical protein
MKKFDLRILWGSLLIIGGALILLQELKIIPSAWGIIWALIFGVAGFVFLYAYWQDRSHWWPLIPGLGLISLGALIFLDEYLPGAHWTGAIFLGGIGLAFLWIYILNRENWWAIIPAGVLLTLSLVVILEPYLKGEADGGIFMVGLGSTFLILGLLPTSQGRMKWSFIPAAVLLIIGVVLLSSAAQVFNYIWPVALILLGGYFIVRNLVK